MNKFQRLFVIVAGLVVFLWMLTAPNWFARGALGRAITDLDIWAQIHLPYPVLTLLLAGLVLTGAMVWLRRHFPDEPDSHGMESRKR